MVHVAAPARVLVRQLSVITVNSDEPVMLVVSAPVVVPPVLLTVNVVGALEVPCRIGVNVPVVGLIAIAPGATAPPVSAAESLPPVVALAINVAVLLPATAGAKRRWMVQLAPAASVV